MTGFMRQGVRVKTVYGMAYAMRMVNIFIKMAAFYVLWYVLYGQASELFPVSRQAMVTYGVITVVLGELLQWWGGPHFYIVSRIRSGTITSDMVRPVYFPFQVFSRTLGESLAELVTVILPVGVLATLVLPISFPGSPSQALWFLASVFLGYLILFALNTLVGFVSFYTLSLRGIQHAYHGIITFFSGAWIPLWFFPSWLKHIADALPFKGLFFTPLSIYIGELHGPELGVAVLHQLVWVVTLLAGVGVLWRVVHSRLTVQGG